MKKSITILSMSCLLLTACSEDKETAENKDSQAEQKHETKANSKKKATEKDLSQVSQKEKLALAFFVDDNDQILSKDEVLTGVYEQQVHDKKEKKKLYKLLFIENKQIQDAPDGMKFYTVYPSKGAYATVVGINDKKLYVGGTQGALKYDELLETGKEYKLKDVYHQNKKYSSVSELANLIEIKKKDPRMDDDTRKDFEIKENLNGQAHLRSQVYGMISDFEGSPLDKDKYLIDIVRLDDDGKWYVHYRNKHGEIVGTYTTKGDHIVKKDKNGKIVEEKKVENKYQ